MEEVIIVLVCLILNGLLAAFEIAFVAVPRPELRILARRGISAAQKIIVLRENPERTLSIIQVGITLVGALSAGVAGAGAVQELEPWIRSHIDVTNTVSEAIAILGVVIPISFLNVVLGELVPKAIALRSPVKITLFGTGLLIFLDKVFSPVVTLLEWTTKSILGIFFRREKKRSPASEMTIEIDELPQHHQQAVLNLAGLESKTILDILVPWKDVNKVQVEAPMDDVVQEVFASGHTRLPVLQSGEVLGLLHTKEFLALRETGNRDWARIIRPTIRIRSGEKILTALRLMQTKRSHMAIVIGPQGSILGIITLEDISEEIWGDIFDEDDDGRIRKLFTDKIKMRGSQKG